MRVTVEVEHVDKDRPHNPDGSFVSDGSYAVVEADTENEATLIAAQLVGAVLPQHSMVLRTTILDIDNV